MKATVLVDNTAAQGLSGEWGLSIYIEYNDIRLLLDTGASDLYLKNAEKLGCPVSEADYSVLSHAHFDHSGGFESFFRVNDNASCFIQEGTGEDCYIRKWIFHKYIGIPKGLIAAHPDRFRFVSGIQQLAEGVWLLPHSTPDLVQIGHREKMMRKLASGWRYDNFSHEQSLVFETDKGLIIFNSCSHGGASNIVSEVEKAFPGKHVFGLIGGFHLFNKTECEVRSFAQRLKADGLGYVCTGHCTGKAACEILEEELGPMMHRLETGLVMEF